MSTTALLATVVCLPGIAAAAASGNASGRTTVASASWGVVATQSTAFPPPTGQLSLAVSNNTPTYFRVVNTGSVSILTYVVAITSGNPGSNVTVTACSVAWVSNACPGTTSTVAVWSAKNSPPTGQVTSGTAITSAFVPATSPNAVFVQVLGGSFPAAGGLITVDMSVSSSGPRQIRAATTTNS